MSQSKLIPDVVKGLNIDSWSRWFLGLAVLGITIQAGLLLYFQKTLPPQVPLFYSLPWGEARLVDPVWLWTLPLTSAAVFLVNLVGSHLLSETVLTRILSSTAFVVTTLALVTLAKIIILGLP